MFLFSLVILEVRSLKIPKPVSVRMRLLKAPENDLFLVSSNLKPFF